MSEVADRAHETEKTASIWTFIALDCASFGLFFLVFMTERIGQAALFDRSSRMLDDRIGLINTGILITSSWLVARATHLFRRGDAAATLRNLVAALVVGSGFALLKAYEYAVKIEAGINPLTNEFFTFYFALTGVHLLHYLVGLLILGVLIAGARAAAQGRPAASYPVWLESGALYWHLVDLLWVFLFAMLYLLGAR
ncbi:cytochrome c oxidase subunit 3 [Sphingomonas sp. ID0503]|uniref:cytochrome c oxidase subunit 3 n=1 Tax=Sphingomonas sp. ID0503 TaxID=3399691 RepID=UPI003AFA256A